MRSSAIKGSLAILTQLLPGKTMPGGKTVKAEGTSEGSGEFAALLGMLQASLAKTEMGLNVFTGKKNLIFSSGESSKEAATDGQGLFSRLPGETKNGRTVIANISNTSDNLLQGLKTQSSLNSTSGKKDFFSNVQEEVKPSVGKKESVQLHSEKPVSEDSENPAEKTVLRPRVGIADDSGKTGAQRQGRTWGNSEDSKEMGTRSAVANAAVKKNNDGVEKKGLSELYTSREIKNSVSLENKVQGSKSKEGFRFSPASESQVAEKATASSPGQQTVQTAEGKKSFFRVASETKAEAVESGKNSQSKETRGAKWTGTRNPDSETGIAKASSSKNVDASQSTKQSTASKTQADPEKPDRSTVSTRRSVENNLAGTRTEKAPETRIVSDARPIETGGAAESGSSAEKNIKTSSVMDQHHTAKGSDKESSARTPADSTAAVKSEAPAEKEGQQFREDVQSQSTVSKTGDSGVVKSAFSGTQTTGAEIFRQVQEQVEEMLSKFSWPAVHRARLSLNPPSLGALDIEVEVRGEQVRATFLTASPVVKAILDSGMDTLRQSFSQAGMDQSETNVFLQQGNAEGRDSFKQSFGNRKKGGAVEAELKLNSGKSDTRSASLLAYGDRLINVKV